MLPRQLLSVGPQQDRQAQAGNVTCVSACMRACSCTQDKAGNKAGNRPNVLAERLLHASIPEATTGYLASLADDILENKVGVDHGYRLLDADAGFMQSLTNVYLNNKSIQKKTECMFPPLRPAAL
eukprot:scaffold126294_cov18-Tisochrysis_lutea.AAC.1